MLGTRAEPGSWTETRPRPGAQRPGHVLAEALEQDRCRLRRQTSLEANMKASRRAVLRGSGALGLALSWAATAAAMSSRRHGSTGIARVFLRLCQGRAAPGAGTSIPVARNRLLRNGPELGDGAFATHTISSPARPDVHGPPSSAGFGISRVLGSAAPWSARRISTA